MKKTGILTLILALLLPLFALQEEKQPIYTAYIRKSASVKSVMDSKANTIRNLNGGTKIDIYEVELEWLLIGKDGSILGYIKRDRIDDERVSPINPQTTPPYAMVESVALAYIAENTVLRASPDENGRELLHLSPGARLAVISFENGWAKLIFKREYGYVDTRAISEIVHINKNYSESSLDVPIAAYTSFYNIATNEDNLNRILNLDVACRRLEMQLIAPGANFDFNRDIGPYNARSGYKPAIVLVSGGSALGYGGGTCQVSSTLFNTLLQLNGVNIFHRHAHGAGGISYLPAGADAAVGNERQNLKFTNNYPFAIRIDGSVQDGALTICIYRAE